MVVITKTNTLEGESMKTIIMALIATASLTASAKYITVEVCGLGEDNSCKMITYNVRPSSPAQEVVETCTTGESYGVCPTETGIPAWLQALNDVFKKHGATAPEQNDINAGGPN